MDLSRYVDRLPTANEVLPAAVLPIGPTLLDLAPRGSALAETETALRELYGRLVYRVGCHFSSA